MGYIAVKGGTEAIASAADYFRYRQISGKSEPLNRNQIREQLHLAVDRVMGEGALYAPDLAALALKQSAGDTLEAAFMVRAYRTTQPRAGYSLPADTSQMRVIRRISAAFKEIPGGQILGPTPDYTLRLLDFTLLDPSPDAHRAAIQKILEKLPDNEPIPETLPKVIDILRRENLLVDNKPAKEPETEPFDLTRHSIPLPAPRSAALQAMAMGETGGLLALAYSNMRGFGSTHRTVGELRLGYLPIAVENPHGTEPEIIGEVMVTEAEVICSLEQGPDGPRFTLGYGLCFGHNETKAISMAVLDRAMQAETAQAPSEDPEFVLMHIDGVESMGFCNHFKLPHYVTFQSALDRLRKAREEHERP